MTMKTWSHVSKKMKKVEGCTMKGQGLRSESKKGNVGVVFKFSSCGLGVDHKHENSRCFKIAMLSVRVSNKN